jgi:hypothetical protein
MLRFQGSELSGNKPLRPSPCQLALIRLIFRSRVSLLLKSPIDTADSWNGSLFLSPNPSKHTELAYKRGHEEDCKERQQTGHFKSSEDIVSYHRKITFHRVIHVRPNSPAEVQVNDQLKLPEDPPSPLSVTHISPLQSTNALELI